MPAGNLFWAVRDEGAYCNGEPIHVTITKTIADALLITGFAYEHDAKWETNMNLFKEFTHVSHGVRRLGSAAADLCYVACGKADGFWEIGLHPWDSAAGILLVKEAGGKVSRMDGKVVFNPRPSSYWPPMAICIRKCWKKQLRLLHLSLAVTSQRTDYCRS